MRAHCFTHNTGLMRSKSTGNHSNVPILSGQAKKTLEQHAARSRINFYNIFIDKVLNGQPAGALPGAFHGRDRWIGYGRNSVPRLGQVNPVSMHPFKSKLPTSYSHTYPPLFRHASVAFQTHVNTTCRHGYVSRTEIVRQSLKLVYISTHLNLLIDK